MPTARWTFLLVLCWTSGLNSILRDIFSFDCKYGSCPSPLSMYCTLVFWYFTPLFFRFNIQFNLTNDLISLHFPVQTNIECNIHWNNRKHFQQRWKNCVSLIFVQFSFSLSYLAWWFWKYLKFLFTRKRNLDFFFNFIFLIFIQFKRTRRWQ